MAAQKAAADLVREWDDRRANGDVSSVVSPSVIDLNASCSRIALVFSCLNDGDGYRFEF